MKVTILSADKDDAHKALRAVLATIASGEPITVLIRKQDGLREITVKTGETR